MPPCTAAEAIQIRFHGAMLSSMLPTKESTKPRTTAARSFHAMRRPLIEHFTALDTSPIRPVQRQTPRSRGSRRNDLLVNTRVITTPGIATPERLTMREYHIQYPMTIQHARCLIPGMWCWGLFYQMLRATPTWHMPIPLLLSQLLGEGLGDEMATKEQECWAIDPIDDIRIYRGNVSNFDESWMYEPNATKKYSRRATVPFCFNDNRTVRACPRCFRRDLLRNAVS